MGGDGQCVLVPYLTYCVKHVCLRMDGVSRESSNGLKLLVLIQVSLHTEPEKPQEGELYFIYFIIVTVSLVCSILTRTGM